MSWPPPPPSVPRWSTSREALSRRRPPGGRPPALDTTAQCRVSSAKDRRPPRPPDPDPGPALAAWRAEAVTEEETAARERPTDPAAPWSGVWWSTPPSVIPRTSRHLGSLGPVGLMLVEDSLGWERALVTAVDVPAGARVLEIDGPDVWAQLCRRHPLPVTAARRHDWYRTTGRGDVHGCNRTGLGWPTRSMPSTSRLPATSRLRAVPSQSGRPQRPCSPARILRHLLADRQARAIRITPRLGPSISAAGMWVARR